jgi:Holliday junction resolvase RusA-like endonuclease
MIKLTIPGIPIAKQRARVTRRRFAFTPAKTIHYETYIKELFAVNYPKFEPLIGPIEVNIYAYFPIPKGTSRKNQELMEAGVIRRDKRPDADNLLKILDALNGLAFRDDSQIVYASIEKRYSHTPRLEIRIKDLEAEPE